MKGLQLLLICIAAGLICAATERKNKRQTYGTPAAGYGQGQVASPAPISYGQQLAPAPQRAPQYGSQMAPSPQYGAQGSPTAGAQGSATFGTQMVSSFQQSTFGGQPLPQGVSPPLIPPTYGNDKGNIGALPGQPGLDYPLYGPHPPKTDFNCGSVPYVPGYYADVTYGCQVWHICEQQGKLSTFVCPNSTIYNQKYFVCDWWYNVNCAESPNFYGLNGQLYQVPAGGYGGRPSGGGGVVGGGGGGVVGGGQVVTTSHVRNGQGVAPTHVGGGQGVMRTQVVAGYGQATSPSVGYGSGAGSPGYVPAPAPGAGYGGSATQTGGGFGTRVVTSSASGYIPSPSPDYNQGPVSSY